MKSLPRLGIALFVLLSAAAPATGQRPLDHADVQTWNTIQNQSLSPDGAWLAYVLRPFEGDPELVIVGTDGEGEFRLRGDGPVFTSDSRFVAFEIPPVEAVLDSLKREGKTGDDLPGDSLAVLALASAQAPDPSNVVRLGSVKAFHVPETGAWLAFLSEPDADEDTSGDEAPDPAEAEDEEEGPQHEKEDGDLLTVRNLSGGDQAQYDHVAEVVFSKDGTALAFATSTEDGSADGVHVLALPALEQTTVLSGEGHYKGVALSDDGSRMAFLTDAADFESDQPEYSAHVAEGGTWSPRLVAQAGSTGIPQGWWVSEHGSLSFSDDGDRLLFGTAPPTRARARPGAPRGRCRKAGRVELERPLPAAHAVGPGGAGTEPGIRGRRPPGMTAGWSQLGTTEVPNVRFTQDRGGAWALGLTDVPYRQLISWDGRYTDVHAIDVETGGARVVGERIKGFGGASLSPTGRYATWWDGADRHWKAAPMAGGDVITLSAGAGEPVWNELDDHPDEPPPYGSAGWVEGDEAFVYYDRYDVFRFEPESGRTVNLTGGEGRQSGVRFRIVDTEPELDHVPEGEVPARGIPPDRKALRDVPGRDGASRRTLPDRHGRQALPDPREGQGRGPLARLP